MVRFSKTSPVLVTGDAAGIVEVFRLTGNSFNTNNAGMETEQLSDDDQVRKLDKAVQKAERLSKQAAGTGKKEEEAS